MLNIFDQIGEARWDPVAQSRAWLSAILNSLPQEGNQKGGRRHEGLGCVAVAFHMTIRNRKNVLGS